MSVGVLHSPPVLIKERSYGHDSLLRDAADLGHDIVPLLASSLLRSWCLTHATTVPISLSPPIEPPHRLFNLTIWGKTTGAGAFFTWLLPTYFHTYQRRHACLSCQSLWILPAYQLWPLQAPRSSHWRQH